MTSAKNIKKLIKNAAIETSREVNEIVFKGLLEELDKAQEQSSAASQPNIWRIIMKKPIAKLVTAAAVILIAVLGISLLQN